MIEKAAGDGAKEFIHKWTVLAKEWVERQQQAELLKAKVSEKKIVPKKRVRKTAARSTAIPIPQIQQIPSLQQPIVPSPPLQPQIQIRDSGTLSRNTSSQSNRSVGMNTMIMGALVAFVLILLFMIPIYSRMATLESRVTTYQKENKKLLSNVYFLRSFVDYLAKNITGEKDSLQRHWNYWRMNANVEEKLTQWTSQFQTLQEDIARSKVLFDKLVDAGMQEFLSNQTMDPVAIETIDGWSWTSILLTLIIGGLVGAYLYNNK